MPIGGIAAANHVRGGLRPLDAFGCFRSHRPALGNQGNFAAFIVVLIAGHSSLGAQDLLVEPVVQVVETGVPALRSSRAGSLKWRVCPPLVVVHL